MQVKRIVLTISMQWFQFHSFESDIHCHEILCLIYDLIMIGYNAAGLRCMLTQEHCYHSILKLLDK